MIKSFSPLVLAIAALGWGNLALAQQSAYVQRSLPGQINAYEYDLGGEGLAYHDLDANNWYSFFRTNEGVDINRRGSGSLEVVANAGEWLEFTVNISQPGNYSLSLNYAGKSGLNASLGLAGNSTVSQNFSGTPGNGDFLNGIFSQSVYLPAGTQVLRLTINSGSANIRGFSASFKDAGSAPAPTPAPTPAPAPTPVPTPTTLPSQPLPPPSGLQSPYTSIQVPGSFNSFHYDIGGEGVAYHDLDANNWYTYFRSNEGVDINRRGSGDLEVAADAGEWLEYTVNAAVASSYSVSLVYADTSSGSVSVQVMGGGSVSGSLSPTGGNGSFVTAALPGTLSLSQGLNVIRLSITAGSPNLRRISLSLGSSAPTPTTLPPVTTTTLAPTPTTLPPSPPPPAGGINAWIASNFANVAQYSGNYTGRIKVESPALVKNATGTAGKYAFDIVDLTAPVDRRVAFANVNITNLVSTDAFGAGIYTSNSYPGTKLYLSNVFIEPNWPAWVSYQATNYDGFVLDGSAEVYAENLTVRNWNADGAIDNKAPISQFVGLKIQGAGNRGMRYWGTGPHYIVNSDLNNTGSLGEGTIFWIYDCSNVVIKVYNSKFNGSSTVPANKIACDQGSNPNIQYLNYDPRAAGEMHPMFGP